MADPKTPPSNREREHENLRVPDEPGRPPRPATEPPGSEWSVQTDKTLADPVSGEPQMARKRRREPPPSVRPASGSSPRSRG